MNSLLAFAGILFGWATNKYTSDRRSERFKLTLAVSFFGLASVVISAYFLRFFARNTWPQILQFVNSVIYVGDTGWFFLLGYTGIITISQTRSNSADTHRIIAFIKWAIIIRIAGYFLFVSLGKYHHLDEMLLFFTTSGYAKHFFYIVLVLECLGALGIILHFQLRTGFLAAAGLLVLMIGAVLTHVNNGDPLSDSADAFRQIIGLIFLMIIFRMGLKPKSII